MLFLLISNQENKVHHLTSDIRSEHHEFAVYPMQNSLEVVALSRVFTIEQLQHLHNKHLRNILGHDLIGNRRAHHEFEEQLINQLQVGPCFFEMGFIFIRVHLLLLFVIYYTCQYQQRSVLTFIGERPINVFSDHDHTFPENGLIQKRVHSFVVIQHVNQLDQGFSFLVSELDFLGLLLGVSLEVG